MANLDACYSSLGKSPILARCQIQVVAGRLSRYCVRDGDGTRLGLALYRWQVAQHALEQGNQPWHNDLARLEHLFVGGFSFLTGIDDGYVADA